MNRSLGILKKTFGYDTFRPLQEEIIKNVINKKDSLVIMPTGGGKSLCYQIPALIFEGLTIVISPLISLMKDQAEQLKQLGINTVMLNSAIPKTEYYKNYEAVRTKKAKLLYIAPESLLKDEISELLCSIQLDCITVDEAHCISEWGHDFRKEYRQLGTFRKKNPSAVCIALTATATPRVQEDIIKNLNMGSPAKFLASFNRENLFIQIIPKRDPFRQTLEFLETRKGQSGIIYCFSRKQVDDLHEELSAMGYSTKPYHAGLPDEERNRNQDLFIKDEVSIIVATIAFGMGINKSNVRFVLHYDLPKNIESYYQEIGRSGRDGLRSDCLLLYSYADVSKINYFIDQKEDELERISAKVHLEAMVNLAESEVCRRVPLINYFGEKYNIDYCGMCDNCLSDETNKTDLTIPSQKFLSAVKRTGEIFGAAYIIDVLTGTDTDRILSNNHHKLSVFGIGDEFNKKQWQMLVRQLVNKQILRRELEFGSLKLNEKAYNILLKKEKVFGTITEPRTYKGKTKLKELEYDQTLFELLRKKRKSIADAKHLPPYVIFSDKSLEEMAAYMPKDKRSFLRISGVGNQKLESYSNIFISVINDYCNKEKTTEILSSLTNSTYQSKKKHEIISESFNNGASIEKLSEEYKVTKNTIISNLERYVNEGNKIRTNGLKDYIKISGERSKEVNAMIEKDESGKLRFLYDHFNAEISFDELRILRILFINERL